MTLIERVSDEVQKRMQRAESGHDWFHVERVWRNAKMIGKKEEVNMQVVELGALLHDIADWKFHDGDETAGPRIARELLNTCGADAATIDHVCDIIASISFKGAGVTTPMKTREGEVVQDADRLDALGAIGIARTFSYGGHKNRLLYDPGQKPVLHQDKEAYKNNNGPTINHFYEKLLLLKDRMNTQTGKRLAQERHVFMEAFLDQFYREWNGEEEVQEKTSI